MSLGGLGTKILGIFNKALLGKLPWKIMNKDSFVFDFLPSRYSGRKYYVSSYIWPSLKFWLLGWSSQVSFYHDNWLGKYIVHLLNL